MSELEKIAKLHSCEALLADYADLLEKADDIGLNVMGNDLRDVQAAIADVLDAIAKPQEGSHG